MLDSNSNIAFLFGSGVSLQSGLGSTTQLTERILKEENIIRLGGNYFYDENPGNFKHIVENKYIERIKNLFCILESYFKGHYSFMNRGMNYEDYYYLIDSLHRDQNMEFENPIVDYFAELLLKEHSALFKPLCDYYSPIRLIDLMSEAKNYIKDLVVHHLNKENADVDQFSLLEELNNDEKFHKIYLFTLNHDTLVEQYLEANKIEFSDGFVNKGPSIKNWERESYKEKINLFKLHGSINWSYSLSGDPYDKKVCIYLSPTRDLPEKAILIGSFNKLNDYSSGINFDLQCLFAKYLNECERLIISGYSFGDKGINSRIIDWLYSSPRRKLIIIHRKEEELTQNSRPAIERVIQSNKNSGTDIVRFIPKWFQETKWAEIKSYLE